MNCEHRNAVLPNRRVPDPVLHERGDALVADTTADGSDAFGRKTGVHDDGR
jgi:hypothetical protein